MFSFLQKINPHNKKQEQKSFSLFMKNKEAPDFVYAESNKVADAAASAAAVAPVCSITKSNSSRVTSTQEKSHTKSPKSHFSRKANLSLSSIGSGYFTTGRFDHRKKSNHSLGTNWFARFLFYTVCPIEYSSRIFLLLFYRILIIHILIISNKFYIIFKDYVILCMDRKQKELCCPIRSLVSTRLRHCLSGIFSFIVLFKCKLSKISSNFKEPSQID